MKKLFLATIAAARSTRVCNNFVQSVHCEKLGPTLFSAFHTIHSFSTNKYLGRCTHYETVGEQCYQMTRIFLIYGFLQHCQLHNKFAKISSKFCLILNDHFQNDQNVLTLCQRGEISPNLVTLLSKLFLTLRNSSKVSSAPSILRPRVRIQAHHLRFFQFVLLKLRWEKDENKQKEAGICPFLKKLWAIALNEGEEVAIMTRRWHFRYFLSLWLISEVFGNFWGFY